MKYTDHYTSSMHVHVRFHVYEPKVVIRVKAVVNIIHGFGEHADRYDHFASYLMDQGFVVVVGDIVGHGQSLIDLEQGFFGEGNGAAHLIEDMYHLQEIIRRDYADVPYFMLGSDMGSVLIRKFASLYGDYVDGLLLLATPYKVPYYSLKQWYFNTLRMFKGPLGKTDKYFSFYHRNLNRHFHGHSPVDWITSDVNEQKKFLDDPMSHFVYTIQGYKDIITLEHEVSKEESIAALPENLPIYLASGGDDPTCQNINKLYETYKRHKIEDVTLKIFPDKRHAILFESNKIEVYRDILNWLNDRTYL
ncbi:MAG: alpha/beta hydrolase [Erysipelotrichaceae bacterium]|nr:alpha/beta hydrolase [Erysipelotrichaceae bacterium]